MVVVATVRVDASIVQLERTRLLQEHLKVSAKHAPTPIVQQESKHTQTRLVVIHLTNAVNRAHREHTNSMQEQQRVNRVLVAVEVRCDMVVKAPAQEIVIIVISVQQDGKSSAVQRVLQEIN